MKAMFLYHPNSEHSRKVEEFCHNMLRLKNQQVSTLSLETKEGAGTARLYDVVRYPSLLVVDNKNSLIRMWQGDELPLMDEVSAYLVRG